MARKKFVTLTRRERAKYRQRLETIKSIRKELTEYKQSGERSLLGARNTNRSIPDLLLPREHKRHLFESKEDFRKEMRELSKYKSHKEYYLESYKRKFAELYKKEVIDEHLADKGEKIKPEGYFGTFTEEQMQQNKDVKEYMDVYNQFQRMSVEQFNRAYWEGFIVPFKYIYKDSSNSNAKNQHVQEQAEMLKQFKESGRMYER